MKYCHGDLRSLQGPLSFFQIQGGNLILTGLSRVHIRQVLAPLLWGGTPAPWGCGPLSESRNPGAGHRGRVRGVRSGWGGCPVGHWSRSPGWRRTGLSWGCALAVNTHVHKVQTHSLYPHYSTLLIHLLNRCIMYKTQKQEAQGEDDGKATHRHVISGPIGI